MSTHVITDHTATPTPLGTPAPTAGPVAEIDADLAAAGWTGPAKASAEVATADLAADSVAMWGWMALSAALTEAVPPIADREDLVVRIAPGAGHGAPACFLSAHATIELDGRHLRAVDPATATPDRISDRARYPRAWGLLVHECAHARHTRWHAPGPGPDAYPSVDSAGASEGPPAPAGAVAAALLLEESRIEAAQIRRRPDDRHWLRASAISLILDETRLGDPHTAPAMTATAAAQAAALLLARADAGILTPAETAPVAAAVETVLGATLLAQLREIWLGVLEVADDDTEAMINLGRRWCEAIGADPAADPAVGTSTEPVSPIADRETTDATVTKVDRDVSADGSGGSVFSPLAEAIADSLVEIAAAVAAAELPPDPGSPRDTDGGADEAEREASEAAAAAAARVFGGCGHRRHGRTAISRTRPPTEAEHTAARRLGRALSTAGIRDRVAVTTHSALPPGRLRMRGALAADAQRAAGAIPTATPFTRTTRRVVPAPPLRVGIACDVSGSMHSFAAPVASAAWILAHATTHTSVPATTATVIFGHHVRAITTPGQPAPDRVTEFAARDDAEDLPTALAALDGALGLATAGAARLLVIVSDGLFTRTVSTDSQTRLDRLRTAGCALLWLAPPHGPLHPLAGATVHRLTDPTTTAEAIGRAATHALCTTR